MNARALTHTHSRSNKVWLCLCGCFCPTVTCLVATLIHCHTLTHTLIWYIYMPKYLYLMYMIPYRTKQTRARKTKGKIVRWLAFVSDASSSERQVVFFCFSTIFHFRRSIEWWMCVCVYDEYGFKSRWVWLCVCWSCFSPLKNHFSVNATFAWLCKTPLVLVLLSRTHYSPSSTTSDSIHSIMRVCMCMCVCICM